MVEWTDTGIILSSRKHGETSVIIDVLTKEHGRHAGLVRGGVSRKWAPVLQPGNQVALEWRARLDEHLGSYKAELEKSRTSILSDRLGLAALGSITAIVQFAFPERMRLPALYDATLGLLDQLSAGAPWLIDYALWEMMVLDDLGYGLDLTSCAATGSTDELIYVSPKSGRSVSASGGADYADRLLRLPAFLRGADVQGISDIEVSLALTGHFLNAWLAPALGKATLPDARARLVTLIGKLTDAKI